MTMGKKDYQLFAETVANISDEKKRTEVMNFLFPVFKRDNSRFDAEKFKEFVRRRIANESLKGLRYNPKYLASSPFDKFKVSQW